MARIVLILFLAAVGAFALMARTGTVKVPPGWNPWGALDLAAAPGPFTRRQLGALDGDPAACFAALGRVGIPVSAVPDRIRDDGCGWEGVGRVAAGTMGMGTGFVGTCPMIAALALLDRQVIGPAAREHLGTAVRSIEHLGTYACRNVYGRKAGRRSEHAAANAIDLAAFRLADGRTVSVARDWNGGGAEARFLRAVGAGACRFFEVVLGPDYNRAHHDHFHLDMGRFRTCS
jgi:hypothetical protein